MSEQHPLSDDQVRGRYCDGTYLQTGHTTEGDDFDAWLARVRREAKAEGWDEGYLDRSPYGGRARSRADNPYRSTEQETRHDDQR